MNYYNDTNVLAWSTRLAEAGHISADTLDPTSINDVKATDLKRFDRCHFFSGIAGWEYALQLAGWPADRPVWTGSCPCQPFSSAGRQRGTDDPRHLWPVFRDLIAECRPATVFGEQVASKAGRAWLAGVFADLEAMGYAVTGADLCAAGVGSPHIRQRLFWVADAPHTNGRAGGASEQGQAWSGGSGLANRGGLGDTDHDGCGETREGDFQAGLREPERTGIDTIRLGDALDPRLQEHAEHGKNGHEPGRIDAGTPRPTPPPSWNNFDLVRCVEPTKEPGRFVEKRRRVEPGTQQVANGISYAVGCLRNGSVQQKREIINATKTKKLAAEVLRAMREGYEPQEIQWEIRRCFGIQEANLLLACLCEYSGELGAIINREAQARTQGGEASLRGLQKGNADKQTPCASSGWRLSEQLQIELADALSQMSQGSSRSNAILTGLNTFNGSPLAHGVPGRVGRLRGYGNAIVPELAAEFILAASGGAA